ncbi:ribonuclease R [Hymenobacter cellulosivorans]|uniref:Ribonuclease R n=1 Tax=Hymenobacter cellulosivorans TaxID=2932249 RepID=A0ABY4FDD0_9BACT|nr:ribonuclease R [Hymenobacter cellulosivorans]UOQ54151.1 ribonuclease R [Hymenobacter cellulosivorans]
MKKKEETEAPRASAKASRAPKAAPAPVTKSLVYRIFADNPGKVFSYRQLSRRLGVTTKEQREDVFIHLKTLRNSGQLTHLQNDDYRLSDPEAQKVQPLAADRPDHGKNFVKGGRPVETEFGNDPIVRRRRTQGFDEPGDGQTTAKPQYRDRGYEGTDTITGTVALATSQYAFIISEESETDVRVFTDKLKFAMQGDTVRIRLRGQRDGRPVGDVVEVVNRVKTEIVGQLKVQGGFGFVSPDHRKLYFDVFVPFEALHGANDGEKVLVRITEWPEDSTRQPVGEIVRSFGPAGQNEAEINAIMAEFGLPFEFPADVEEESEAIPDVIPQEEIAKRRDFRPILTFTIDPADAKDFDDALSLQKLENGHWEVGVHIADVTHYVTPGTMLEKEAKHRATSVYLVDRVIPMLPERLSNGVCSLRPHEDKLTFSAVFEFDEKGKLYDSWFGKTIIHSDRRFSYEEAQERIETKEGDYAEEINLLNDMAKKICAERFRKGAISFETQEVKFRLDGNGKPLGVYVKERKDAHKLIEEFMLMANRKVAEFVYKLKKTKPRFTMVYRTHDAPDADRLQNFALFAQKFGHTLDLTNPKKLSTELNDLSTEVIGRPEQNVIQTLAVRTMSKAKYTTEPMGHFGLAFEHYSHFTSPIRRYPDMMAHRLLEHYLQGGKNVKVEPVEEECKHSSEREKLAANAERASIKYKQVEFMADVIGEQFKGVVSGLTEWGLYVEIEENKCEGMIRLSDLPGDFYELDKDNYRLIGQRNKKIIQFGDEIQVVVKAANLLDRTIDFEVVDNRPDYVKDREQEERRNSRSSRGGDRSDRGPRGEKPGGGRGGKGGGRPGGSSRSGGGDKRRR